MKAALLVSGLPRGDIKKNLLDLNKFFPFDTYFGTWQGYASQFPITPWTFEEPEMLYHPGYEYTSETPKNYQRFLHNGMAKLDFWKHRTKQIILHAKMCDSIVDSYDMIIRARPDTVIDVRRRYEDIKNLLLLSKVEKRAIGFYVPKGRNSIDLSGLVENPPDHDRRLQHLPDHLIIHPRSLLDTSMVYKMHEDQSLQTAEWGWYQVLSQPHGSNHLSFLGFAGIEQR